MNGGSRQRRAAVPSSGTKYSWPTADGGAAAGWRGTRRQPRGPAEEPWRLLAAGPGRQLTARAPRLANLASPCETLSVPPSPPRAPPTSTPRPEEAAAQREAAGVLPRDSYLLSVHLREKASFSTSPWCKADRFSPVALRWRRITAAAVCGSNFRRMRTGCGGRSRRRRALRRTAGRVKGTVRVRVDRAAECLDQFAPWKVKLVDRHKLGVGVWYKKIHVKLLCSCALFSFISVG